MRKIIVFFITAAIAFSCDSPGDPVLRGLAGRIVPEYSSRLKFEISPDESQTGEWFELEGSGRNVIIRGNNRNSAAVGLNYYLKNYCLTTVSWFADEPVIVPARMPAVPYKIRVGAKVAERFFLNYCTYGYSMPWWGWEEWERFIDWMALNGINLPLAITGQEAIWYNVWRSYGMTDEQIRSYFTGPAHLPWHRMTNIDKWDGPLPGSWIEDQAELQKKIVAREREFDMRPVLPAFAGHVPGELTNIFPDADITKIQEWAGFGDEYLPYFLSSLDPLFNEIQHKFLEEQTRLYGTDHIYGVDPFNEIHPPSWDPDSLAYIAANLYNSLSRYDPEAVWLQMGWLFYADSSIWEKDDRIRKFLRAVPQDKLLMLDYFCEFYELWEKTDRFHGQPYIWCYLGNFGGNTMLQGNWKESADRLDRVLAEGGPNFRGIGSTLEGLGTTQYIFEYIFDRAWDTGKSREQWLANLADRRAGFEDAGLREVWKEFYDKIFLRPSASGQGQMTNAHPTLEGIWKWTTKHEISYDPALLYDLWTRLIAVRSDRDAHRFDIVNTGREVLGNYFLELRDRFARAYIARNIELLNEAGVRMTYLLADMERLVSCHDQFSLEKWINSARSFGVDKAEADYYEKNARTILTVWGDSNELNDYANRSWSGLISSFYAVRWRMFIDEVTAAAESGRPFDQKEFDGKIDEFQSRWIEPSYVIDYPARSEEVYAVAEELAAKYSFLGSPDKEL